MVQTISSLLCEPLPFDGPLLKILLNVTISKDGNYAFSKFSNDKGDYFSVNPSSHITMRYTPKGVQWKMSHQIVITQRNIFQLRLGLKTFYSNFQRNDNLYMYDDYGKIVELLATEEDTIMIPLTMGQLLRLRPSITEDRNGKIYPGVNLTINEESNQVDLTIVEFEEIYDLFNTINIYQSGLTLLQTYIGMRKRSVEDTMTDMNSNKPPSTKSYIRTGGSMFDRNNTESFKSPPTTNIPKTLNDL